MKFVQFKDIMSVPRMNRYLMACSNDSKKAMTLYRKNLKLSQELFTIVSCFEVSLRNRIDTVYQSAHGNDWLYNSARPGGFFDKRNCQRTQQLILNAYRELGLNYSHHKLIAEMDFGFWRYFYAQPQFFAGGQILLHVFPNKPRSSTTIQYNQSYIFNQLKFINELRNRIAHHEPICFVPSHPIINSSYTRNHYILIKELFQWMNIDEDALLYGLDHVLNVCDDIDNL